MTEPNHPNANQQKFFDIGANLTSKQLRNNTADIIGKALQAGVDTIVITGTDEQNSADALTLCEHYSDEFPEQSLYCTAGVHPHDAKDISASTISRLKELATHAKVKAIGETGLDFNRNFSPPADQEKGFNLQLELASELRKPVFLHERDAHERFYAILKSHLAHLPSAVIHCFTGDKKALYSYLDLDCYIGITGWVCDERRGKELQALVKNIPSDRLLIETDAPYLLPRDLGVKPKPKHNEPSFLPHIAKVIAELRNESLEHLAMSTYQNSKRFFQLK